MEPTKFDEFLYSVIKNLELKKSEDLQRELDKISKAVCEFMHVDRASIWLYKDDKQAIFCESLYKLKDKVHERDLVLYKKDFNDYFVALEDERIINAIDAHRHYATRCFSESYLTPVGIKSMFDAPIRKADGVIGVICLEYLTPKEIWTNDEKNFIVSMADQIAKIYEKLEVLHLVENLEKEAIRRTQELRTAVNTVDQAKAILAKSEKLISLGTVIAGIAHELRNPLNHILGSAEIIREMVKEDSVDTDYLKKSSKMIIESAHRAETIIKDMLNQTKDHEDKTKVNIKQMMSYALKLVNNIKLRDQGPKVQIINSIDEDVEISVFKNRLHRVFINMFENSLHSGFEKWQKDKSFVLELKMTGKVNGNMFQITIEDNAMGIPEDKLANIFEPFFTTKGPEVGTGLGLSITMDVIKNHNGKIEVKSQEGQYTKFIIDLPIN